MRHERCEPVTAFCRCLEEVEAGFMVFRPGVIGKRDSSLILFEVFIPRLDERKKF